MALFGKQKYCSSCMSPVKSLTAVCPVCGYNPSETPSLKRYLRPQTVINDRFLVGLALSENPFSVTYMGLDLAEKKKKIIKEYCPFSYVSRVNNEFEEVTLSINSGSEDAFRAGLDVFINTAKKMRDLTKDDALPGIIKVTNIVETKGTCYAIHDYEEGETIKKLLKKSGDKLDSRKAFSIMKPLMNSLSELHKNNIIHGNISPYNIVVSPDMEKATLIGFGLYDGSDFELIPRGGFTPIEEYAAFKGALGPWTDIYGLSTTLYYAITGIIPPDAPDRTVDDEVELPSEMGIDISEDKEAGLIQGMGVYEQHRFKAVKALYNAIYSEEEAITYFDDSEEEQTDEEQSSEDHQQTPVYAEENVSEEPVPEPVPEPAPAPAPAPAPVQTGGYSQVIVRRHDRNTAEVMGEKFPITVTDLDLSGRGITDSDTHELEKLVNVEYLKIDRNKIGDIEFVGSMRKLITLSARANYIEDISALVNLSELREIDLAGNNTLSDMSVMEYLRKIRKLDISDTAVTDIGPLFYLDQLKSLDLRGTKVNQRQIKRFVSENPTCAVKYDYKKK